MRSWYEITNQAGKPVKVTIEGEIGAWGVSSKSFRSDIERLGKNEKIQVHIMSGGGSVFDGNEIKNILDAHEGEIEVTLGSICASIATVIMCAGDTITAKANSLVMIHNPSVYAGGDAEELRKTADVMDKIKEGIIDTYAARTGRNKAELSNMMDDETWMTAKEALANGFIDAIDEDEEADDKVVDNVDLSHYKNLQALFALTNSKPVAGVTGKTKGNLSRLTLSAIRNAANITQSKTTDRPTMKTPEEIEADKAEITKQAKAEAAEMRKREQARSKEIRDLVAAIQKRDGKDFTELANEYLDGDSADKTADDFAKATIFSAKYKNTKPVGSGIELTEPMDRLKGTPGYFFALSEQGRAICDKFKSNGRERFNVTLHVPADFQNATQTETSPHTLTKPEYKPGVAPLGLRPLRIKQIIPGGVTNAIAIIGRREDAFTDDAATVLETGALANVAVSVIEVTYPVRDVGGYIEISENALADFEQLASLINVRLPYKVERVTDYQLLNGGGTGADLTGILNTSGYQTQAKAGDTAIDSIYKAKTNVETVPNAVQANAGGGYNPDFIIINPTDWQNIRLAKDSVNQYYGGGPFSGVGMMGYSNVDMFWGLPVVRTTAISAGTALVGAFAECAQWFQRQGLTIEMTNANGTNFVNRIVTIRAAERLALTVDQPNGFCAVTGL